ncbi:hypothetical protein ACD591_20430 [Rufibacter glacialis]|uniref:Porin family protein n=1 Tax=Rufibacter glacialis TaxID=1259555 RepID=A0A5M8QB40_9BACT|nr:hypothetical protein [Rufibacter glacialis]KAA6432261.1 hypothetical protein FOE74_14200 [Rufibacter glacialis]GGK77205.1 hypothetical protein GCM10011405_26250 [Rufibacter glacialis]
MKKWVLLTLLLLLGVSRGQAQYKRNLNVKYFGLTVHPKGDDNADLMPLNPDGKGYLVLNVGASVGYEHFLVPGKFSVKAIQALYADCAMRFAGFTHLGLRAVIFQAGRHSLNGGLGPTLVYRRNWSELDGYNKATSFFGGNPNDKWQSRMIWYAGEFEYNYRLSDRVDFSTSFVPGYPDIMSLSFGLRYWLKD